MIAVRGPYYNACCDGCGRMLPAERSEKAAEASARRVGWAETDGKLLCGVCEELREKTGQVPDRKIGREKRDERL